MTGTQKYFDHFNRGVRPCLGFAADNRNNGKIFAINTSIRIQMAMMNNNVGCSFLMH